MRTADLERLEQFYEGVLGFEVLVPAASREGSVWLDAGGAVLMLERGNEGEPGVAAGSMDLVAFAIGADEKGVWRARIEGAGVRIEAETAYTLYFRDPDGRRLAVSSYPLQG